MSVEFTIKVKTVAESLEDEAIWDCEEAVKDTLKEWGIEAEASAHREP